MSTLEAPATAARLPSSHLARLLKDTTTKRARWRAIFSAPLMIAAVALFIVVADNDPLWQTAWRATHNDDHRLAILSTIFALVFVTLTTVLSFALGRKLLRAVAALLLLVAASCGFFMTQYGVVIDQSMIRNTVETTVLEATPLLSGAYFWHVALYGVLPAILVFVAPLARLRWPTELSVRFGTAAAGITLLAATLYVNYAAAAFFGRENDDLKLQINPVYPLWAAATFGMSSDDTALETRRPLDVQLAPAAAAPRKPALVVLVMGETARADRFSFNGYERDTNRYTRPRDVVNFPRVVACGTSTAESVPCIFSGLGQAHFSHAAAMAGESVVGAMQRLGVDTFWRDNSTGCKNVCDEQHFEQRANWTPRPLALHGCFDECCRGFRRPAQDRTRPLSCCTSAAAGPAYHMTCRGNKEFFPSAPCRTHATAIGEPSTTRTTTRSLHDYSVSRWSTARRTQHRVRHGDAVRIRSRRVARRERPVLTRPPLLDGAARADRGAHVVLGIAELLWRARERRSEVLAPLCPTRHEPRRDFSHALADLRSRVAALPRTARPLAVCRGKARRSGG
jgi:hypothetical protein